TCSESARKPSLPSFSWTNCSTIGTAFTASSGGTPRLSTTLRTCCTAALPWRIPPAPWAPPPKRVPTEPSSPPASAPWVIRSSSGAACATQPCASGARARNGSSAPSGAYCRITPRLPPAALSAVVWSSFNAPDRTPITAIARPTPTRTHRTHASAFPSVPPWNFGARTFGPTLAGPDAMSTRRIVISMGLIGGGLCGLMVALLLSAAGFSLSLRELLLLFGICTVSILISGWLTFGRWASARLRSRQAVFARLAQGDLTATVRSQAEGPADVQRLILSLRRALARVQRVTGNLHRTGEALAEQSGSLLEAARRQGSAVDRTLSAVGDMGSSLSV